MIYPLIFSKLTSPIPLNSVKNITSMTNFLIKKSTLKGEVQIPSSKSQTLRAILFASMAQGKSLIEHFLPSPDTQAMINACRCFGASIEVNSNQIAIIGINGTIKHCEDVINAGNSGIVLRFCSAVGALAGHPVVVTGDHSIRHQRPIRPLLEGLAQLGVSATTMRGDGFAPVIVQGPIKSGFAEINGEDSQPVSALLIAAAYAKGPIELKVKNPGEKSWVDLTLDWFKRLDIPYVNNDFKQYHMRGHSRHQGFEYTVPGDMSSAAFPIAAALITQSEITIRNANMHDLQGDKEVIRVFQKMGANIEIDEKKQMIHVKKSGPLNGIDIDINDFIDGLPIIAVVACFAEGETRVFNGAIAKQKECNRISSIASELKKMKGKIIETADGLIIRPSKLYGGVVNSYNDHRMAMSLAVAGLGAEGDTIVSSVDCVSKSFPNFLQKFRSLQANIYEQS